jgi:FtsH-binding integral membrane protein
MVSRKAVTVYNYVSLGIMAVLLVVMWQQMVPAQWYWHLFAVALVLFLSRIALRLILERQGRLGREVGNRGDEQRRRGGGQ